MNTQTIKNIDKIKSILSELPNFSEEDVKKINDEVVWIASGGRSKYYEREKLLAELKRWGRAFGKRLSEEYGIRQKHINYSTWEYGNMDFTINIYYTFPRGNDDFRINSKEDFAVSIGSWRSGNYKHLGYADTPEEAVEVLADEGLYEYK